MGLGNRDTDGGVGGSADFEINRDNNEGYFETDVVVLNSVVVFVSGVDRDGVADGIISMTLIYTICSFYPKLEKFGNHDFCIY